MLILDRSGQGRITPCYAGRRGWVPSRGKEES
jgi:hypothetical protein